MEHMAVPSGESSRKRELTRLNQKETSLCFLTLR